MNYYYISTEQVCDCTRTFTAKHTFTYTQTLKHTLAGWVVQDVLNDGWQIHC